MDALNKDASSSRRSLANLYSFYCAGDFRQPCGIGSSFDVDEFTNYCLDALHIF